MSAVAMPINASLHLSVIVPAHRCAAQLRQCLRALRESTMPQDTWEIIVVDDGSGDDTVAAAQCADRVISVPDGPRGPAHARNAGALVARSELLLFVDADVVVSPDAPSGFVELFRREPELAAAFGAYDATPADPGFISQYRNLLHHFVHLRSAGTHHDILGWPRDRSSPVLS